MKSKVEDTRNSGNLLRRSITGFVLVIIITWAVLAGKYSFFVLILMIDILSLFEFYRLIRSDQIQPRRTAGVVLSFSILITVMLVAMGGDEKLLLINLPLAFLVFIRELFLNAKNPFLNLAITFFGVFYITVPLCFFIEIPFLAPGATRYQYQLVLGFFLILWASDTGAFFVGRSFGRHQLFGRISPGKTWEGVSGGLMLAMAAALIIARFFSCIDSISWMMVALIIVVTGIAGDLIKSMLKRSLNLKDSGKILPGHGGMLDRFDSLIGSAPFVFCYLLLSGNS